MAGRGPWRWPVEQWLHPRVAEEPAGRRLYVLVVEGFVSESGEGAWRLLTWPGQSLVSMPANRVSWHRLASRDARLGRLMSLLTGFLVIGQLAGTRIWGASAWVGLLWLVVWTFAWAHFSTFFLQHPKSYHNNIYPSTNLKMSQIFATKFENKQCMRRRVDPFSKSIEY